MAGKFSLLTTLTLDAAGFNSGLNKAKQSTADFSKGLEAQNKALQTSFGGIKNKLGELGGSLNGSLGGIPAMLSTAVGGFKSMTPAITGVRTALIASGIGAIVVGLGLAFAALTSYLSGTSEGAAKVKAAFSYITGAATELMNRIKYLGKGLFSLLTGDIEGFKSAMKEAFKAGFINDVVDKARTNNALTTQQIQLKKEANKLALEEVEINARVAELKAKAKDYTAASGFNDKQRNDFQRQAIALADEFEEKKKTNLYNTWKLEEKLLSQKAFKEQGDNEKLLEAKRAYFDFITADYQEQIGENKVLAKTEKAITDEIEKRIEAEKQLKAEIIGSIELTKNRFNSQGKAKGKADFQPQIPVVNKDDFEAKKLQDLADTYARLGYQQEQFTNKSKTGWQQLKESIGSTQYITETFGTAINGLSSAFTGLFEGTKGGFKDVVTSMLQGLQTIINGLLAEAIAGMIAKETSSKGIIGLVTASVGLSALIGLWKSKVPAFADGGIVNGNSLYGDKITARVNSGEMILNRQQQANLFKLANTSGGFNGGGGVVKVEFVNGSLEGYIDYKNKRLNSFR